MDKQIVFMPVYPSFWSLVREAAKLFFLNGRTIKTGEEAKPAITEKNNFLNLKKKFRWQLGSRGKGKGLNGKAIRSIFLSLILFIHAGRSFFLQVS